MSIVHLACYAPEVHRPCRLQVLDLLHDGIAVGHGVQRRPRDGGAVSRHHALLLLAQLLVHLGKLKRRVVSGG